MNLAATSSDMWTDDGCSGNDGEHEFIGTDAVYCGRTLRLVSQCRQCSTISAVLKEVPEERPRRCVCPFCGEKVVMGGMSLFVGVGHYSVGRVCLSCHASIREETDPATTRSIRMICSEPSTYDDRYGRRVVLPPLLCGSK
jgi:hypothetical protein